MGDAPQVAAASRIAQVVAHPEAVLGHVDAVIIAAQIGAAWAFSADGKADPTLAERSVGRLFHLAQRAKRAGSKAQASYESSGREEPLHADLAIHAATAVGAARETGRILVLPVERAAAQPS